MAQKLNVHSNRLMREECASMAQKLREEETRNFQMETELSRVKVLDPIASTRYSIHSNFHTETELSRVKVLDPIASTRCCPNFKLQRLAAGGDAEHSPREIT
jgi:hypothetical protein